MRILIGLVALLFIANVALFLWPDSSNSAPHIYQAQADVNPHFIRLNKEIEERFYSQIAISPELVNDIQGRSNTDDMPLQSQLANAEGLGCYRVGPFMHKSNYELAQAVLFNANVDYKKSRRPSAESQVTRLFLGPFASAAEVGQRRLELKQKRILDHFVRKQDDDTYIISLGIYSSPASAESAQRLFNEKLDEVKQRPETVLLPESYWLHFDIGTDRRVKEQLNGMDWGEPSAKMGLHECL